jgi:hypothetical protein|tara:strand:+ start:1166 stop:1450 length:285 start_codon:yes stop_codon:yes gene_type:complete
MALYKQPYGNKPIKNRVNLSALQSHCSPLHKNRLPKEARKAQRIARRKSRTGDEKFRLGAAIVSGLGVVAAGVKTAIDARRGAPLSGPLADLFR